MGRFLTIGTSFGLLGALLALLTPRRWGWVAAGWVLGTVALAVVFHRWPVIAYRYTGYRVDEEGIEIAVGVIWRAVMNVPRSRVQHIDVAQGPLERKHGLGRLVIYTAGTEHSRVELPGLAHATALRIRDRLLPRTGDDAV